MKTTLTFSTLLASALALPQYATPSPTPSPAPSPYFSVISARSASPIHLLPLEANGGKFYLGGTRSAYCPADNVGEAVCAQYPGNTTTLAGGYGTLSLGVVVPGGQQVYVAPDGTLSYTVAHSAAVPEGSVREGWTRTARADPTDPLGSLSFEGGLVACPRNETQPWQVYGEIEGFEAPEGCLGFSAITYNLTEAGAWQY